MDEPFAIDVLSGRKRGLIPAGLRAACAGASWGYGAAIHARNWAFDSGWNESISVGVPVVSLGNITTGGTGKTPMVAYFAEMLRNRGYRPGIVSRGYRSLTDQTNDERLVLEQLVSGVPQVLNRDRVAGANTAIQEHGCDVVLLDDGFQHRRLRRDLDVVLIDATRPWGFGHLLPRGLLREPLSSLRRADLVLITRCDQVSGDELTAIRQTLLKYRGTSDVVDIRFVPRQLRNVRGDVRSLSLLKTEKCLPFCGIGNPEGFRRMLAGLGVAQPPVVFPDHHHYQSADVMRLAQQADEANASVCVTTQKDLVKFAESQLSDRPLWAVEIAAEVTSGVELMDHALNSVPHAIRFAA